MTKLQGLIVFCLGLLPGAVAAAPNIVPCVRCGSAPAPLIGMGLPVALVMGGVFLGAKLVKRWR